jgi:hypothetical protein
MSDRAGRSKKYQAFVLAFELSEDALRLKLCRVLTLARLRFAEVAYLRVGYMEELFSGKRLLTGWRRSRIWPCTLRVLDRRRAPLFVMVTRKERRRIFLRLEPSFHYLLRTAIGRAHGQTQKEHPLIGTVPTETNCAGRGNPVDNGRPDSLPLS